MVLISARKPPAAAAEPLVSIGITSYNRAAYIIECVESVLRQTHRNLEVIVVDDGSTDNTRALLEPYQDRIQMCFHDSNLGIAAAKNRALRLSSESSRYVGILDSDDYLHPQFVEHMVRFLEQRPEIGLVYSDDILVDSRGREISRQPAVEPWNVEEWLRTSNLRGDTWLARRDLVMCTRLHDESLSRDVDYDLFYQLLEFTTFAHVPEFLVYIRRHPERATNNVLELAKCHAANLVRYGYSSEYAYLRARRNPEWIPAIEEGIRTGLEKRQEQAGTPTRLLI
jgi:glycosyltransferase involved in cell wall biosynthesis